MVNLKNSWINDPFPHLVIDNFLEEREFDLLCHELDQSKLSLQRNFSTPLESKSIYKNTLSENFSMRLINQMNSPYIKDIISKKIGSSEIMSLSDINVSSGHSPYHITKNNGFLGTHVDHSSAQNGKLRHIANTIFYAISTWNTNWGGQTIFFSKNGFIQKVLIDTIPNRLVIFIHSANSFHGVKHYYSDENVERRNFYHDYYVYDEDIDEVMSFINKDRSFELSHCYHGTTFIPFIPYGLNKLDFKKIFNIKNLKYLPVYLLYISNYFFGTKITSLRNIFKFGWFDR